MTPAPINWALAPEEMTCTPAGVVNHGLTGSGISSLRVGMRLAVTLPRHPAVLGLPAFSAVLETHYAQSTSRRRLVSRIGQINLGDCAYYARVTGDPTQTSRNPGCGQIRARLIVHWHARFLLTLYT
jgi:hypothetical protein